MKNKVVIVGSGGREHALGWKLGQNDDVSEVIYAPGNAGTREGKGRNISLDGSNKKNFKELLDFVKAESAGIVLVGPEAPLAEGIVDFFNSEKFYKIFGPTRKASFLEADKFFSYDLMEELGLPQADSVKCFSTDEAITAIEERTSKEGIVLKARGLTGGKGVAVCDSKEEALLEIRSHAMKYGPEVVVAERLFGEEFSVFGISDGNQVFPLEVSLQDHKPLYNNDKGPNTGGMGAYGPVPFVSQEAVREIAEGIMTPLVQRMGERGNPYKGFLYTGCMMTRDGPKVLEFNVRFGDPECQPAMMLLGGDLYELLSLGLEGKLGQRKVQFNAGAACCVVLASQGYPEGYKKGLSVQGLEEVSRLDGVKVFHAGTVFEDGKVLTSGGRVLGVTGYSSKGIKEAQRLAYDAVSRISIPEGFHYRTDIGSKAIK